MLYEELVLSDEVKDPGAERDQDVLAGKYTN
jgi:hypothetical protein